MQKVMVVEIPDMRILKIIFRQRSNTPYFKYILEEVSRRNFSMASFKTCEKRLLTYLKQKLCSLISQLFM